MQPYSDPSIPPVLTRLALALATEVNNWRLNIPQAFGKGYCTGYIFNPHLSMMIFDYELDNEVMVSYEEQSTTGRKILFKFQHVFSDQDQELSSPGISPSRYPSVLIVTRDLSPELCVPIHSNSATINIEIDADYLHSLLHQSHTSPLLQHLLNQSQPLFFEQIMYPYLLQIVDEILAVQVKDTFKLFFLRVKAEELICRLLVELEKRSENKFYAINNQDLEVLYQMKDEMLARLDTPPVITKMAMSANMSPTKLKRLFKQIFGTSIFNYYQEFRIKEAGRMLTKEQRSVAETGHQLGFTNLSHFSRVFKAHTGMNPKQFSRS